VVTWSTPPSLPGATPGACTPPTGSTFPLGTSTVTCQVLDAANEVAMGTFQVTVQPFTRVLVPSNGAALTGAAVLDASGADAPGITSVVFEVSGGTLSDQVIATATPTLFGWLAKWNTTNIPNGTYTLQSVATDTANSTETSNPITVTVNNQPPTTAVTIPSGGVSLSGATALLDALASSAVGIASVTFEVSGNGLSNQVVATGTPTIYGYFAQWNTTAVPNGYYTLQSVATDTVAERTTSAPVAVTVDNTPPSTSVLIPSNGATQSGTAGLLDASASAHVTALTYELNGNGLTNQVIATGTPTLYGWLAEWNTTTVPNGTYDLTTVASYAGGVSGASPPIIITVSN
jgi:Bacterial Ig domain/HYR domain